VDFGVWIQFKSVDFVRIGMHAVSIWCLDMQATIVEEVKRSLSTLKDLTSAFADDHPFSDLSGLRFSIPNILFVNVA